MELDDRVTNLEENGGGGGNSSVAELEQRVEALEGTAAEQETRLTAAEENIQGNYVNELLDKQSKESTTTISFECFEFSWVKNNRNKAT